MTDKIVVLSTCGSSEEGLRIARSLVESRLAACVNIVPAATSVYRWEGRLEQSSEVILIIKSSRELFGRLQQTLLQSHSYEVPEVLALPVLDGSGRYLNWIEGELVKEEQA